MDWRAVCLRIAIVCIHLRSSQGNQPWDVLPQITEEICPNTCIWKTLNTTTNSKYCCKECSCDDDCGLDNNCCFEVIDKRNEYLKSLNSCTTIETRDSPNGTPAYHMVENNPIDGCIIDVHGIQTGDQCGSTNAANWGSLYPVISRNTGKIYKNKLCAMCHNDTNFATWTPIKVCQKVHGQGTHFISNSLELHNSTGKYPDNCFVSFYITGFDVELDRQRCLLNPIDYCKNPSFVVPNDLNVTRNEVSDACTSGFRSQIDKYANIFCWMCSSGIQIRKPPCNSDQGSRFGRKSILIILDPEKLSRVEDETKKGKSFREACVKNREGHVDQCVRLFCPTGQMWIGNKCEFLAKEWAQVDFRVFLKLKLIGEPESANTSMERLLPYLIRSDISTITASFVSPWKKRWNVRDIYYYEPHENSTSLASLLIGLSLSKKMEPANLINEISSFLNAGHWQLNTQSESFRFSQEFANLLPYHKSFLKSSSLSGSFQKIHTSSMSRFHVLFTITKLFFCDQIELSNDEFVINPRDDLLYYNATRRYLHDLEFGYLVSNIEPRARICMSDSIYTNGSVSFGIIYMYSYTCCFAVAVYFLNNI